MVYCFQWPIQTIQLARVPGTIAWFHMALPQQSAQYIYVNTSVKVNLQICLQSGSQPNALELATSLRCSQAERDVSAKLSSKMYTLFSLHDSTCSSKYITQRAQGTSVYANANNEQKAPMFMDQIQVLF